MSNEVPATIESQPDGKRAYSGLAGAGGGTSLILIAENLLKDTTWQALLVYFAPSVSVLLGWLFYVGQVQTQDWYQRRKQGRIDSDIDRIINDPSTSQAHRIEMQALREDLQKRAIVAEISKIKVGRGHSVLDSDTGAR